MVASKFYSLSGLTFLLVTLALFCLIAAGFIEQVNAYPRIGVYRTVNSGLEFLWPSFSWLLLFSSLGLVLAALQRFVMLPVAYKLTAAVLYGFGALVFPFEFTFNMFSAAWLVSGKNPFTWTVFLGGPALMLSLVLNAVGVALFRELRAGAVATG
jgi:hypothetical protein